jgi:hypothetical protein
MRQVDLNASIASTLIARSYRDCADLGPGYGTLPPITYAGRINQVVLNLVVNSRIPSTIVKRQGGRGRSPSRLLGRPGAMIAITDLWQRHLSIRHALPIPSSPPSGRGTLQGFRSHAMRS